MKKTMVIKFGGSIAVDPTIKKGFFKDIAALWQRGYHIVICHGGGPEINAILKKLGQKPKFVNGLRVTDAKTIEIVEMVLSGKVNKDIVGALNTLGAPSIGLSGKDGKLLLAKKIKSQHNLGFVGEVAKVNTKMLLSLMKEHVVVVSSLGTDAKGQTYNINADMVATKVAQALKADRLVLLTDVKGVLANAEDSSSTLPVIKASQIAGLIKDGVVTGGMIPKIRSCYEAILEGVHEIDIIDGRVPHAILKIISTTNQLGTRFTKGDLDGF
ncbi:MAG: acetylglutamate kinase [bacterium]|nr:acetylglutamate kinase [bacterium]MDD5354739.1 acetylglutamate kinase [bacterium]